MTLPTFTGDKQAYVQSIAETCPPRNAELADVDRIIEFDHTVFPEGRTVSSRTLIRRINENPISNEILELDNQIVACTLGDIYPSNIDAGRCYGEITSIGVAAAYRGRGLGEFMLSRMVASMLEEDPTGICLYTRASNLAMQSMAAKRGFAVEDRITGYYVRTFLPEDALLMVYRPDTSR